MVFSFFKKDPKDTAEPSAAKGGATARAAKPSARPLAAPVNRNASATVPKPPNTESSLPDKDLARTLAMETAAKIDAIESETFSPLSKTDIEPIYMIKREVVELRRAVSPLTVALARFNTDFKDLMSKEVLRYMRDVLDHQSQAADRIASYDEMLSSLVQAALAKVGMQQNTDMRKISAYVAIAAVPTMIAGIYGMNFEHMPELSEVWGSPAVLLLMATICGFLYITFRRNHWL